MPFPVTFDLITLEDTDLVGVAAVSVVKDSQVDRDNLVLKDGAGGDVNLKVRAIILMMMLKRNVDYPLAVVCDDDNCSLE